MVNMRKSIVIGIVAAALFWIAWVYIGLQLWPQAIVADTAADRIAYALGFEIYVALMLLLGVVVVANRRFFSDASIDGSAPEASSTADINCRYLQNTLEQAMLALVGHMSLALVVPIEAIHVIPVLVMLFVFARICFWIGYHISPQARAFGFAATFHPTILVFLYVIVRVQN